jgi:septal ring factor EnvC (AmiA/AmiB activator)
LATWLPVIQIILACFTITGIVAGAAKFVINWWSSAEKEIARLKNDNLQQAISELRKTIQKQEEQVTDLNRGVVTHRETISLLGERTRQQNIEINKLVQKVEKSIEQSEKELRNFRHTLMNGEVVKVGNTWIFKGLRNPG